MILTVDGVRHEVSDELGDESLLRVLREELGLTAAKNACEQGECGSCTVRIDGQLVCACLVPTGQAAGLAVSTVASAGAGFEGGLHPVQLALLEHGAVQCGFCTPGIVMAASDLLERVPRPSEADVREALAGNLCRCTGYGKIVEAVLAAAALLREGA
jgi:carbon-monoxide dehydrogenase small subunit